MPAAPPRADQALGQFKRVHGPVLPGSRPVSVGVHVWYSMDVLALLFNGNRQSQRHERRRAPTENRSAILRMIAIWAYFWLGPLFRVPNFIISKTNLGVQPQDGHRGEISTKPSSDRGSQGDDGLVNIHLRGHAHH